MKIIENKDNPHLLNLEINLYEVLHDSIAGEQRENLIQSLSCADEIIGHVAEQLIDGYTYNGFSGTWATSRNTALQQARQRIAENSDYAVKRTIQDMENEIKSLKDDIEYYRKNYIRKDIL